MYTAVYGLHLISLHSNLTTSAPIPEFSHRLLLVKGIKRKNPLSGAERNSCGHSASERNTVPDKADCDWLTQKSKAGTGRHCVIQSSTLKRDVYSKKLTHEKKVTLK